MSRPSKDYPAFGTIARVIAMRPEGIFVAFQIALWVLLVVSLALFWGPRWRMVGLALLGLLLVAELEHLVISAIKSEYYPGSISALLFIPLAIAYWREFLRVRVMNKELALSLSSTVDPVCGMEVYEKSATAHADFKDERYYFCSEECKARFLTSPDRYLV